MKAIIRWWMLALCLVCGATLTACSDDEPATTYFVRYSMGNDPDGEVFMSYMDTDGEHIIQGKHATGKVDVTVGPVEQGFEAGVAASVDGHAPEWLRIEVCRGSEPFVQKKYLRHGTYITWTVGEEK